MSRVTVRSAAHSGSSPETAFSAGIDELRDQVLASHPNFRVYAKDSGEHVWLLFEPDKISPRKDGSGKHLADWISEMLDPSATWDSVTP